MDIFVQEEELSAEGEITRLTKEARSLFKAGKYSEAKLYLEVSRAQRLCSSCRMGAALDCD